MIYPQHNIPYITSTLYSGARGVVAKVQRSQEDEIEVASIDVFIVLPLGDVLAAFSRWAGAVTEDRTMSL